MSTEKDVSEPPGPEIIPPTEPATLPRHANTHGQDAVSTKLRARACAIMHKSSKTKALGKVRRSKGGKGNNMSKKRETTTTRRKDCDNGTDGEAATPPLPPPSTAKTQLRRNTTLVYGELVPTRPGAFSIKGPPPSDDNLYLETHTDDNDDEEEEESLEGLTDEERAFILDCSSSAPSISSSTRRDSPSPARGVVSAADPVRESTCSAGGGVDFHDSLTLSDVFVNETNAAMAEDGTADDENNRSGLFLGNRRQSSSSHDTPLHGDEETPQHSSSATDLTNRRNELEISPGQYVPYHGSVETMDAIRSGSVSVTACHSCHTDLVCVEDAELVICPDFMVISPVVVEDSSGESLIMDFMGSTGGEGGGGGTLSGWIGGVGLGLKI